MIMVSVMLKRHYPNFHQLLDNIPDHRKRSTYQVSEIIMAGLSIFIFKRGSRHHTDQSVKGHFEDNYTTLFGLRLPICDTVNDFLAQLAVEELEQVKKILVQTLIEKRFFDKHRFNNYHPVAVDGTGLMSFDNEPFEGCPYKVSKNNKKTWSTYVLEAKLVCSNGLSISIGTEWYLNSQDIDAKQDCELKAFVRLAAKLKQDFPRLPILILADSLYPNNSIFDICQSYQWAYIFTFKDGTLKSVWKKINQSILAEEQNTSREEDKQDTLETIHYINQISYHNHDINWLEYKKYSKDNEIETERFVHISSIKITSDSVWQISEYGRLRWKIENQGFNTQKNQGYNLQHKYARKNLTAMRNYYQLLQIAHLINQLTEKLLKVKQAIQGSKLSLKALWEDIMATMQKEYLQENEISHSLETCKQLRY